MEVVRIEDSRLGEASDVLARAFQGDPAWVWLIPDAERRRRLLPWFALSPNSQTRPAPGSRRK